MVAAVGDEHIAVNVDRQSTRKVQLCTRGGATLATKTIRPGPRERGDYPRLNGHSPNAVVGIVDDEHVAVAVQRQHKRTIQTCARRRTAVATKPGHASPCQRGDDPRPHCHPPDAVIGVVGDKEVTATVYDQSSGKVQTRARGRAAVTIKAANPRPCQRRDRTGCRSNVTDAMIPVVCDEHATAVVHRHLDRCV